MYWGNVACCPTGVARLGRPVGSPSKQAGLRAGSGLWADYSLVCGPHSRLVARGGSLGAAHLSYHGMAYE
jgi:hypothetical protein